MKEAIRLLLVTAALLLGGIQTTVNAETPSNEALEAAPPQGTRVVINGTGVRLRLGPGKQYDYYSNALAKGSSYPYRGTYGDWYAIDYNGRVYYVSASYSYLQYPQTQSVRYVVINGTGVRLRLGPGKQYDYYSNSLEKGSMWPYEGTYGNWYAINYYGTIYYVASAYSYLK